MTTPAEAIVRVQHSELQAARGNALTLRKQLEAVSKELAVCRQQLKTTQKSLQESEVANATQREYSRSLEQKLELAGKGVALVKAAKLQSELEQLQRHNGELVKDLSTKAAEVERLQDTLARQQRVADQAARSAGLTSGALQEELGQLRSKVSSMSEQLAVKDSVLERQERDLQGLRSVEARCGQLDTQCRQLRSVLDTTEADKNTLLDYIQEMQHAEGELVRQKDTAAAQVAESRAVAARAEAKARELQTLLNVQLEQSRALQGQNEVLYQDLEGLRSALHDADTHVRHLKAQEQSVDKQLSVILSEVERVHGAIQATLDTPSPPTRSASTTPLRPHTREALARIAAALPTSPHTAHSAKKGPTSPHTAHSAHKNTPGRLMSPSKAHKTSHTGPSLAVQVVTALGRVSSDIDRLISQHTHMRGAVQGAETLRHEHHALQREVDSLQLRMSALSSSHQQLEHAYHASQALWGRLWALVHSHSDVSHDTPAVIEPQEVVTAVEARIQAAQQSLSSATQHISALQTQVTALQGDVTQLSTTLAIVREDRDAEVAQAVSQAQAVLRAKSVARAAGVRSPRAAKAASRGGDAMRGTGHTEAAEMLRAEAASRGVRGFSPSGATQAAFRAGDAVREGQLVDAVLSTRDERAADALRAKEAAEAVLHSETALNGADLVRTSRVAQSVLETEVVLRLEKEKTELEAALRCAQGDLEASRLECVKLRGGVSSRSSGSADDYRLTTIRVHSPRDHAPQDMVSQAEVKALSAAHEAEVAALRTQLTHTQQHCEDLTTRLAASQQALVEQEHELLSQWARSRHITPVRQHPDTERARHMSAEQQEQVASVARALAAFGLSRGSTPAMSTHRSRSPTALGRGVLGGLGSASGQASRYQTPQRRGDVDGKRSKSDMEAMHDKLGRLTSSYKSMKQRVV